MTQTPNRRWFQFSLSSLLWLTVVVALAIAGGREHRLRVMMSAEIKALTLECEFLHGKAKMRAEDGGKRIQQLTDELGARSR